MKIKSNLKAGGYVAQAQDQAEQFFKNTDQFLQNAGEQIGQTVNATVSKLGRVWNCVQRA
jgi:enamine deaminase RidA (YjgF/YER057c/UK114 family)